MSAVYKAGRGIVSRESSHWWNALSLRVREVAEKRKCLRKKDEISERILREIVKKQTNDIKDVWVLLRANARSQRWYQIIRLYKYL